MFKKLLILLILWPSLCFAGASRSFDGIDDKIDTTSTASISATGNWTICGFVMDTGGTTGGHTILSQYIQATGNGRTLVRIFNNKLSMFLGDVGIYTSQNVDSAVMSTNIWYFFWVTREGATFKVTLDDSTTTYSDADAGRSLLQTGNWIGARTTDASVYNGAWSEGITGRIAYLQIYNRTLSASELTQLRRKPGSITNGLVRYYPLWGSNSPEINLVGTGFSGTVTGAAESMDGPPIFLNGDSN